MKFDVTKNGQVTILKIHERKIDVTISSELKAEFLVLCKPKLCKKLIVDLSNVELCDSSGLSAFLIAHRAMREHGGTVHLANVRKNVLKLIKISQLERVFTINKTVAAALKE